MTAASLDSSYWSCAVKYASQSLLCHALQKSQKSLPFGGTVVAQLLGHCDVKFPDSRSITGRLPYWDHLRDQVSYVLCPPESPDDDPLVYWAGLPVKLPPGGNLDDLTLPDVVPKKDAAKIFDKLLSEGVRDKKLNDDILDLDPENDNDDDDDVLLETSVNQTLYLLSVPSPSFTFF